MKRISLPDLLYSLNPDPENEPNHIEHSLYMYYSDQEYKSCMTRANIKLRMLNLNVGGLYLKLNLYVIKLQLTWISIKNIYGQM